VDQNAVQMERRVKISSDLSEFLSNIGVANDDKSSVIGSSIVADHELNKLEAIKRQKWYIIKFQSFCESPVNPLDRRDYDKYYVLAEVKFHLWFNKLINIMCCRIMLAIHF
jgi:hypothetical protein